MGSKKGAEDGQGIEMSPSAVGGGGGKPLRVFSDLYQQPGLETVEHSNLEVVSPPRPGLSSNNTWERASHVPEMATYRAGKPAGLYPSSPSDYEAATPYSTFTPDHHSYDHLDHTGAYVQGIGGNGRPPGGPAKGATAGGFFQQDTILGVRKKMFWIIMAIGVFVMVSAVVIGVGLGVALHKDDVAPAASNTSIPGANSTSTGTPTQTILPIPTATAVTSSNITIKCPANNQTLYTINTNSRSSFLLLCGRDYSSTDGATDLYSVSADTMAACIGQCAQQAGCVGAGWGSYNGQLTCWLKSALGSPNWSENWHFAVSA